MAELKTKLTESQNKTVLEYLSQHNTLTSTEAFRMFGIERLAARVNNLKNKGIPIEKEMVCFISRSGHPGRYAKYYLAKEDAAKSCAKPCGPSDWKEGGKCDKNGCYSKSDNQ